MPALELHLLELIDLLIDFKSTYRLYHRKKSMCLDMDKLIQLNFSLAV